ncbi:hypothetical protein ACTI_26160 [Actinoplanes sp. OR16]|nr:hypothetical protein ACTI_26160 [Actinoplanes sp. OR16]
MPAPGKGSVTEGEAEADSRTGSVGMADGDGEGDGDGESEGEGEDAATGDCGSAVTWLPIITAASTASDSARTTSQVRRHRSGRSAVGGGEEIMGLSHWHTLSIAPTGS